MSILLLVIVENHVSFWYNKKTVSIRRFVNNYVDYSHLRLSQFKYPLEMLSFFPNKQTASAILLAISLCFFSISLAMIPLTIIQKKEIVALSRGRSNRETAVEFNRRHPERAINKSTVQRILGLLNCTGSLHRRKRNTSYALSNSTAFIEQVRSYVKKNPMVSIKQVARDLECSRFVIHKVLRKKLKCFPYKKQIHHKLLPLDAVQRLQFSRIIKRWHNDDRPDILKNILWSDEKQFTMTASFNRQNHRYEKY